MNDCVPARLRLFDLDRRGFETEREYGDVDILFMTHLEAALRAGRAMQIEPVCAGHGARSTSGKEGR